MADAGSAGGPPAVPANGSGGCGSGSVIMMPVHGKMREAMLPLSKSAGGGTGKSWEGVLPLMSPDTALASRDTHVAVHMATPHAASSAGVGVAGGVWAQHRQGLSDGSSSSSSSGGNDAAAPFLAAVHVAAATGLTQRGGTGGHGTPVATSSAAASGVSSVVSGGPPLQSVLRPPCHPEQQLHALQPGVQAADSGELVSPPPLGVTGSTVGPHGAVSTAVPAPMLPTRRAAAGGGAALASGLSPVRAHHLPHDKIAGSSAVTAFSVGSASSGHSSGGGGVGSSGGSVASSADGRTDGMHRSSSAPHASASASSTAAHSGTSHAHAHHLHQHHHHPHAEAAGKLPVPGDAVLHRKRSASDPPLPA